MAVVTIREMARLIGAGESTIRDVINRNKHLFKDIRQNSNGMILLDSDRHRAIIKRFINPAVASPRKKSTRPIVEESALPDPIVERPPSGSDDDVLVYADVRTKREYYTAQQAKLSYERQAQRLVPIDAVMQLWTTLSISVQKALITVPDRIAPLCVMEPDQHVIHKRMSDEIKYALKNLAFELKSLKTEVVTAQTGDGEKHTITLKKLGGRPKKTDEVDDVD